MQVIVHIAWRAAWEEAQKTGTLRAASLASEGFLHCSTGEQVVDTVNARFAGREDVLLLCVDPARTEAEIRFEPGRRANAERTVELFPHIYGPLNLSAVFQVIPLAPNAEGRFTMPEALRTLMNAATPENEPHAL